MKLRNKKTGKIKHAYPVIRICDGETDICYSNIAEVNAEWEDYKPAEPLIKDEKIRKAVRAWAKADLIKKAYLEDDYTICADDDVNVRISFSLPVFKDVGSAYDYTIAELCGEEEE